MKAGEWLVHNAANSSLAKLITRVAAHQGIRSISVVRRLGFEEELKANGADHVLVDGEDLAQRVRALLGGEEPTVPSTRLRAERLGAYLMP